MRYKIIETDNFGGDYPDEKFVSVPSTTKDHATAIAKAINAAHSGDYATRYWRVVPEDYELVGGFEP